MHFFYQQKFHLRGTSRCTSAHQQSWRHWGILGDTLEHKSPAKAWVCKFEKYIVVNFAYGGPGNWQRFLHMFHVRNVAIKFVYNSQLRINLFLCWKHCLLDPLHNRQICHRCWIHHGHGQTWCNIFIFFRSLGGQIQAMLLKRGLGFGYRQRAHVACGQGFRCVVGGNHPRCCGRRCPRITSLLQGRWRWHEQGGRTISRWGQRWRLGARGLDSGGLWLWRVGGWTLLLLRSNGLLLQQVNH